MFTVSNFPGESGCVSNWNNGKSWPTWSAQAWGVLQINVAIERHWIPVLWLILEQTDPMQVVVDTWMEGQKGRKTQSLTQPGTWWEPHGIA